MASDAAAISPAAAELEPETRPQYEAAMGGISLRRALSRAMGIGLPFAVVGALTGVHEFANQALPHILSPDNPADYQETLVGLPVPHLLDWNPAKIEFLQIVGGLSGLVVTLCFLALYGGLVLRSISALNPTFRLLRIRSASAQYRWLAFDAAALGKAFRAVCGPVSRSASSGCLPCAYPVAQAILRARFALSQSAWRCGQRLAFAARRATSTAANCKGFARADGTADWGRDLRHGGLCPDASRHSRRAWPLLTRWQALGRFTGAT